VARWAQLKRTARNVFGVERPGQMAAEYEERANNDHYKLEQMMLYGQIGSCRWKFLLDYFGEDTSRHRCGHCDNCLVPPETRMGAPDS